MRVEKYIPYNFNQSINNSTYEKYGEMDDYSLIDIIDRLSNDTEHLVNALVNGCENSLWEYHVELVVYYELGIPTLLNDARNNVLGYNTTIIHLGRTIVLHSRYRETSIQYIVQASYLLDRAKSLRNSTLKKYLCRYRRNDIENRIIKLYNITRKYLLEESVIVLRKIVYSKTTIPGGLINGFLQRLGFGLNNSYSIYANETLFYKVVNENPLNALRALIRGYIDIYSSVLVLNNTWIQEDLDKLLLNTSFIGLRTNMTIYFFEKLYNGSNSDPLKLLSYYLFLSEYYRLIHDYYNIIYDINSNYLNQSTINDLITFTAIDDIFIQTIFYPDIIESYIVLLDSI